MRLDERNMLAPTTCLYRHPIQSYRRKRITLTHSAVRAAVRDLGHRLTATIARMVKILSDTVICHSPKCYMHSM